MVEVNSGRLLPEEEISPRGGIVVPRGSRSTLDRLAHMRIGGDFLSEAEKQLFVDILFEYEGRVALEDSEMGTLKRPSRRSSYTQYLVNLGKNRI